MNLEDCIKKLGPIWYQNDGVTNDDIYFLEGTVGRVLPDDFKEFLEWSNGGQGKFENIYISLWRIGEYLSLDKDYSISGYLGSDFLAVGSDGGPICFLFDYRNRTSPKVVSVNFGDLDINEIKNIADSFTEFLDMAISGNLVDRDL